MLIDYQVAFQLVTRKLLFTFVSMLIELISERNYLLPLAVIDPLIFLNLLPKLFLQFLVSFGQFVIELLEIVVLVF